MTKNEHKFVNMLKICEEYISNEETKKAYEYAESIEKQWQKSKKNLNIFINHNEVDSIDNNLKDLSFVIKNDNKTEALKLCDKTKRQLLSIKERQLPHFRNII